MKESMHLIRQSLLTSVGVSIGVCVGAIFGFSSIFLAQIKNDKFIVLKTSEESWLASAPTMLLFPICLLSSIVIERAGRKLSLFATEVLALICWILMYFSENYTMLLISRLLTGVHMGVAYPTLITYIGEATMPKYRNVFLASLSVGGSVGTFMLQYLGEYLHWQTVAIIFAIFPLYDIIMLLFLKDSYVTRLDRNNIEKAYHLFKWYRGCTSEAKLEFDDIISDKQKRQRDSVKEILGMCARKSFLVPFGITTLIYLTNEMTAIQPVVFYTSKIIDIINDEPDFAFYANLALNILRIVALIFGVFLLKFTSVRFVLISSGFCLGISLLCLALFMYLSETYEDNTVYPILSLCALVMNTMLYSIGLGPLPSVICGEMFPEATRSIGGSISASLSFLFLFIMVWFMPVLLANIGSYWTFCSFGICTLVGITASNFVLPNTKNKTLQEINRMFQEEDETKP